MRKGNVRVGILWGKCPGRNFFGWEMQGVELSQGWGDCTWREVVRGETVHGFFSGGDLPRTSSKFQKMFQLGGNNVYLTNKLKTFKII